MASKKCLTAFLNFHRLIALRIQMGLLTGPNLKERIGRLMPPRFGSAQQEPSHAGTDRRNQESHLVIAAMLTYIRGRPLCAESRVASRVLNS
jgi:hypothetical protein